MVRGGATLIGNRPVGSPSLADDPTKVREVLDELWTGSAVTRVGKGRVFASASTDEALKEIDLTPDFAYQKPEPDSHVMFIHRRLPVGDVYFLSNRIDRAETIEASFRVTGMMAELWDPATGLTMYSTYHKDGDRTRVTVPLDRFGSTFVVFRKRSAEPNYREVAPVAKPIAELTGPWQVAFQPDRGAPATAIFEQLVDFRDNPDPGIRYFSGTATYSKDVEISKQVIAGGRLSLDLGQVGDLAEVWVNGKLAGTAWKPPYKVDISRIVKPGLNHIEVRVTNLWVNRLIGDVQPGVRRKITFTAVDGKLIPTSPSAPAGRRAAMPYRADAPLRPSGLIGPVTLLVEHRP
jgi:hypothetical protein